MMNNIWNFYVEKDEEIIRSEMNEHVIKLIKECSSKVWHKREEKSLLT
jgi:hypothetical protein